MRDTLLAIAGFLVLLGFLAILVMWVPRVDLTIVVLITLGMAAYDFAIHARRNGRT